MNKTSIAQGLFFFVRPLWLTIESAPSAADNEESANDQGSSIGNNVHLPSPQGVFGDICRHFPLDALPICCKDVLYSPLQTPATLPAEHNQTFGPQLTCERPARARAVQVSPTHSVLEASPSWSPVLVPCEATSVPTVGCMKSQLPWAFVWSLQ